MEDAGNGEFKRDFFAFIQEEATRLKARHRDSLLSTKEGEKRPTNITVDQTEKNIKSLFISIISVYLFFVLLVIVHVAYYFGLNKNAYLG